MITLSLPKPYGFHLQAASDFYSSFTPGSGMAAARVDRLTLAFRLDRTFDAVAVSLREVGDALLAEVVGTDDTPAVEKQVSRMLGLDADGDAWLAVGERDEVVGRLQREFSGFFTAAKASPYDAATWAVIAPRLGMPAAARIKMALAERHGDAIEIDGRTHHVFPSPTALERLTSFPGLPEEKVRRLRGVAVVALEGKLEADRLRAMGERAALAELLTLRGVGPWAASHIFYRGAAPPDALPTVEPRVLHGMAAAYGTAVPDVETFERAAEAWRPFRMWVCVLLSRQLARQGGWRAPELGRERAKAGKRLATRVRSASHAAHRAALRPG